MTRLIAKALVSTAMLWLAPVSLHASDSKPQPFFTQLTLQEMTFQVESPNQGSINLVTVRAQSKEKDLGPIEVEADGTIANVEVADLDGNGFPEVYIYVNSAGSGAYGSLIAYASNRNLSISEIYLPPLDQDPEATEGYMGHDEFAVGENALLRRFPVYREGDVNAAPSGGMRQVQYRLVTGEAGWVLEPHKVINF